MPCLLSPSIETGSYVSRHAEGLRNPVDAISCGCAIVIAPRIDPMLLRLRSGCLDDGIDFAGIDRNALAANNMP